MGTGRRCLDIEEEGEMGKEIEMRLECPACISLYDDRGPVFPRSSNEEDEYKWVEARSCSTPSQEKAERPPSIPRAYVSCFFPPLPRSPPPQSQHGPAISSSLSSVVGGIITQELSHTDWTTSQFVKNLLHRVPGDIQDHNATIETRQHAISVLTARKTQ